MNQAKGRALVYNLKVLSQENCGGWKMVLIEPDKLLCLVNDYF